MPSLSKTDHIAELHHQIFLECHVLLLNDFLNLQVLLQEKDKVSVCFIVSQDERMIQEVRCRHPLQLVLLETIGTKHKVSDHSCV